MPEFRPSEYGPAIVRLLGLAEDGLRLMPLAGGTCASEQARGLLGRLSPEELLGGRRIAAPDFAQALRSGLYLYFSCLDEAHKIAQEIPSSTGSYWHGILHRQEPDFGNAAYWFRRVGRHDIFPALRDAAAALLPDRFGAPEWDPFRFLDACEQAHARPGAALEQRLREIQRAEWQLLFDYCWRRAAGAA